MSKCDTLSKAFVQQKCGKKSLPISQTFLYTYKKIDFFKVSSFFIKDAKIITEVGQIFLAEKARFINITDTQKNPPRA